MKWFSQEQEHNKECVNKWKIRCYLRALAKRADRKLLFGTEVGQGRCVSWLGRQCTEMILVATFYGNVSVGAAR